MLQLLTHKLIHDITTIWNATYNGSALYSWHVILCTDGQDPEEIIRDMVTLYDDDVKVAEEVL